MCSGKEDVAQFLDDLGSLSDPMRLGQPGAQPTPPVQKSQTWHFATPFCAASRACCILSTQWLLLVAMSVSSGSGAPNGAQSS